MSEYAPIVLFTYNRPEHTRRTLESLSRNPISRHSRLVIFSDGPKSGSESSVAAVRAILREKDWCGNVEIHAMDQNQGLAASIVRGVSTVLETSERIIVLEDDLELSSGFLDYMNQALAIYAEEPQVMSVSAWVPPMSEQLPDTFFLRTTSSWGWATWGRAWKLFEPNALLLARRIEESGQREAFNIEGGYDYFQQLQMNAEGRLNTWAVLWYASIFLANGLTLHPRSSLVRNTGHDGSGTHSRPDPVLGREEVCEEIQVRWTPVEAHAAARRAFRRQLKPSFSKTLISRLSRWTQRLQRRLSFA